MKKLTTEDFIKKAEEIHGNKYDYSDTTYISARDKLKIICREHGEFYQLPSQHFRGQGCVKCTDNYFNLEKFIQRSKEVHGDKYDYSKVEYTGSKGRVKITCPEHGEFEQMANEHMRGRGCSKCAHTAHSKKMSYTTEEFIKKAKEIHGDIYDYSEVDYINSTTPIVIICPSCGPFKQRPINHNLYKFKCPLCNPRRPKTQNGFMEQASEVHGDKYDYSKVVYTGITSKVKITCPEHGEFEQVAGEHIRGHGCPNCAIDNLKLNQEEVLNRFTKTHGDTYGYSKVDYVSSTDKVVITCDTHGDFEQRPNNHIMGQGCPKCNSITSKYETEMQEFLSINKIEFLENKRDIIPPKELDIYIPELNMAIEFNGNYWHSELNGKDRHYHLSKTIECEKKGIHLLHIFESEWLKKKDIWKSIITTKLGKNKRLFARKCKIKEIDTTVKNEFLDDNHLQGQDKASIKLGLYYEDELLAVMTFIKSRFNKNYEWELSRFASKRGYTIVGGASKLLKHFIRNFSPKSVISYADKRHSNGNLYKQLGFVFLRNSDPNYFYSTGDMLELKSRQVYQKHKLKNKLELFDPNLTEWENMKLNGYDRIWDCGNSVWAITLP